MRACMRVHMRVLMCVCVREREILSKVSVILTLIFKDVFHVNISGVQVRVLCWRD